jgi:hypothetical protein
LATPTASTSSIDICARALVLVGANPITSFEDGTTEATITSNLYEDVVRADLSSYRWRFATKQAVLNRLADAPTSRWDAAYQLPSDVLTVNAVTVADKAIDYDIYGDDVYANAGVDESLVIDYVYRPDESEWPPHFVLMVQYHMASILAGSLARDSGLAKLMADQHQVQNIRARSIDSQQQTTRRLTVNRFLEGSGRRSTRGSRRER